MLRCQLPAHSPVHAAGILAGVRAALSRGDPAHEAAGRELCRRFFARDAVLTDSGTSALTAALLAVRAGAGRCRIGLPAYSCYDVATAADGADAEVVLYDLDPQSLAPDPKSLRDVLDRGVSVLVVAHLYGVPVDVAPLRDLCATRGVRLIEDGAQVAGAEVRGRPAGSGASVLILSFGRGKGVTAGRGGAVLGGDVPGLEVVAAVRAGLPAPRRGVRTTAPLTAQWLLGRPGAYAVPASLPFLHLGETRYHAPAPPGAMSRAAAAVLASALGGMEAEVATRRHNARLVLDCVGESRALRPLALPPESSPGYLRLPLVASPAARRLAERPASRRLGIMPGYPLPLARLPGFGRRCVNATAEFPGATHLAGHLITLPTHSLLTQADLRALRAWIREAEGT
jgi:perosamine synthetase